MVYAIYELITVECYLFGILTGIRLQSYAIVPKISLFGVFLIFAGAVINFPPVYFLGAFLSCFFVGTFFIGIVEELRNPVRDTVIFVGCILGIIVLTPYVTLQKLASKLRKNLFLL